MKRLTICLTAAMLAWAGCDTTPHVAPNGNDSVTCGSTAPFRTFARAYQCAQDPAVVTVEPGVYPPQTIPAGSKQVVFTAPQGATVRASSGGLDRATLEVEATNVAVNGINVDSGGFVRQGLAIHNGGVLFKNAAVGNVTDEKGALVAGPDIMFDHVLVHDVRIATAGVHNEGIFAINVPRFTVKNSTFTNNATMDLFFNYGSWWPEPHDPGYGNVTIVGNHFDPPHGFGDELLGYPLVAGNVDDDDTPGYSCPGSSAPLRGKLNNWTVKNNYIAGYGGGSGGGTLYLADTCPAREGTNWVYSGNTGPGA